MNRQERIGRTVAELRGLTDALHKEIESGTFYRRRYLDRRRRIGRIKQLYGKLIGRLTWRETAVLVPAVAVLAMAMGCEGDIFISDPFFDNLFDSPVKNAFSFDVEDTLTHSFHFVDLDGDGDLDIVDNLDEYLVNLSEVSFVENEGTPAVPDFVISPTAFPGLDGLKRFTPLTYGGDYFNLAVGDIDGDGDADIITIDVDTSDGYNKVGYYRNNGTDTAFDTNTTFPSDPDGVNLSSWIINIDGNTAMNFTIGDIDGDGDLDVVGFDSGGRGSYTWTMSVITNSGTPNSPNFSSDPTTGQFGFEFQGNNDLLPHAPRLADLDDDGDLDLLFGSRTTSGVPSIFLAPNTGTPTTASFATILKDSLGIVDASDPSFLFAKIPAPADIDDDGDVDLFVTEFTYRGDGGRASETWYYKNTFIP